MDAPAEIYQAIVDYLEKDNILYYESKTVENLLFADYHISREDCPFSVVQLRFIVDAHGFDAIFNIRGIKTVSKAKDYMAVLLAYINDGIRYGSFTMDGDSSVSFVVGCILPDGGSLDYEYFDRIVCLGLAMMDRYSSALVPVMLGYSTDPKAAYESVESEDEDG